jgi:hypothetical protein
LQIFATISIYQSGGGGRSALLIEFFRWFESWLVAVEGKQVISLCATI